MMHSILTTTLALALFGAAGQPLLAAEKDRGNSGNTRAAAAAQAGNRGNAGGAAAARGSATRGNVRATTMARAPQATRAPQSVQAPRITASSVAPRATTAARTAPSTRSAPLRESAPVLRAPTRTTERSQVIAASRAQEEGRRSSDLSRNNDRRDWDNDRGRSNDRDWNNRDRWSNNRRDWDHNRLSGWQRYRYYNAPIDAYRGWDRNRIYSWNNHRYHWYGGSWVIVDPGYAYVETTTLPVVGSNVVIEVQAELQRAGYDPGPADGVMGGRTRSAIAQYQADRGLTVTARIDRPLLASLGID